MKQKMLFLLHRIQIILKYLTNIFNKKLKHVRDNIYLLHAASKNVVLV